MPRCEVHGCRNKSYGKSKSQLNLEKSKKITFHRFPKDEEKKSTWIKSLGIQNDFVSPSATVCSVHFADMDFYNSLNYKITRLRDDAVPIKIVATDKSKTEENVAETSNTSQVKPATDSSKETITTDKSKTEEHITGTLNTLEVKPVTDSATTRGLEFVDISNSSNNQSHMETTVGEIHGSNADSNVIENVSRETPCTSFDHDYVSNQLEDTPKKKCIRKVFENLNRKRLSSTSLDHDYVSRELEDTPRKIYMRKALVEQKKRYEKKISVLMQKTRRQKKRIAGLNGILKELKKKCLLLDEHAEILKSIGECNADILKRFAAKSNKKRLTRQYSPNLRKFALTLHYYSPKAYNYVRKHFDSCLPHPKSISKWYKSINAMPGFMQEAFNSISERVKVTEYPLVGTLIFDEMSIRQHIEYTGEQYSGYVDFGDGIVNDSSSIAKDALVFLFVCMNSGWKVPVGYFLINGITADQKSSLVLQCIGLLHESGVRVVALTFDGTACNFSVAKQLQCKLMPNSLQTWFSHPVAKSKIYIFPDPCHMVKLVRNIFGDLKTIKNASNEIINWNYITELHKLQSTDGLHLANKLNSMHVHYKQQKMKVRFATQLFSKSVAQALEFCDVDLKLPQFAGSCATSEFLTIFNDLFDIFNSKNMYQYGYKQPINELNSNVVLSRLEECKQYISNLRLTNGTSLIYSVRKTGILGFLICIESLKEMYKELCIDTKILKYIPTYKVSQDHIELFFGCVRSQGGHNNNPTARQFKAAMKKLLINSEITNSGSGNCIPLENITILHVTSSRSSEEVINITTNLKNLNDNSIKWNVSSNVKSDHDYIPDIVPTNEYASKAISYIAGFVVKQLRKTINCEECLFALTSSEANEDTAFILHKSRGNLTIPSSDVIFICKQAEKIIRSASIDSDNFINKEFTKDYLVNSLLMKFVERNNLFLKLKNHVHDQYPLESHDIHLIKAVAGKYITVRLHHLCKNSMSQMGGTQRHFRNKLTLFEGR